MITGFFSHSFFNVSDAGILYITLPLATILPGPISSQEILQPYLDATLALSIPPSPGQSPPLLSTEAPSHTRPLLPQPLFTVFYMQHPDLNDSLPPTSPLSQTSRETSDPKTYIIPPPLYSASPLPDVPDDAATNAETVFWEVIKLLKIDEPPNASDDPLGDSEIESFWPPLDTGNESGEEEW